MPKLKMKKTVAMVSRDEVFKLGEEYLDISAKIKELETQKKALSDQIKTYTEQYGVKDDKGSFYLENDNYVTGKVAKKSFKLDEDKAVKILEDMGLGDLVDVETIKTVNEDKLSNAVADGRIDLDTVKGFTIEKVTYSVSVKAKEEMPEIEQSEVKMAARRK